MHWNPSQGFEEMGQHYSAARDVKHVKHGEALAGVGWGTQSML